MVPPAPLGLMVAFFMNPTVFVMSNHRTETSHSILLMSQINLRLHHYIICGLQFGLSEILTVNTMQIQKSEQK